MFGAIAPGEDVEAWCTRCRMNLNHRIIAVVGSEIKRVHCLTCGGDHKYYPPKRSGKTSRTSSSSASDSAGGKTRRSTDKSKARAISEWNTFMNEMPPDTEPRPYSIYEAFRAAEYIQHPVFGVGRVLEIVGAEKIQVIFEEGRKVLVCNRRR